MNHVRWIAGGTGAGKSTVAGILSARYAVEVYDGDRAEHEWVRRCTPERHPHLWAAARRTPAERLTATAHDMAGWHGETMEFLVEDLGAGRTVLVDYFGVRPRDLAPVLATPADAVFLLPTPALRAAALGARYADANRARANWGDVDHRVALARRLERDAVWDAEVRRQASGLGLAVIEVDGSRSPDDLADELADRFRLG